MRGQEKMADSEGGIVVESPSDTEIVEPGKEPWIQEISSPGKPGFLVLCARDLDEEDEDVDSDFFYDDGPFFLDILRTKQWISHHIRKNI